MTVMIDWLTLRVPCQVDGRLDGGTIVSINALGDVEWESPRRLAVEGSHSSRIMVRGGGSRGVGELEISGNPAKWLQGHNLFGSGSVRYLGYRLIAGVVKALDLRPTLEDRRGWWRGEYDVLRADVTRMYDLGTPARVIKFLKSAHPVVHAKYQRASVDAGGTVYVGKHSRRVSLKFYEKYGELLAKGHGLADSLSGEVREQLMGYAYGKLRAELTLRSTEIADRGLRRAKAWRVAHAESALDGYLSRLDLGDTMRLAEDVSLALPRRLQLVYDAWRAGRDIRAMYSKTTFYRYRQEFLRFGIDLLNVNPRAIEVENRSLFGEPISMRSLITGGGCKVPDWALGTELYCGSRVAA